MPSIRSIKVQSNLSWVSIGAWNDKSNVWVGVTFSQYLIQSVKRWPRPYQIQVVWLYLWFLLFCFCSWGQLEPLELVPLSPCCHGTWTVINIPFSIPCPCTFLPSSPITSHVMKFLVADFFKCFKLGFSSNTKMQHLYSWLVSYTPGLI